MPKTPLFEFVDESNLVPAVTDAPPQAHMLSRLPPADQATIDAYAVCRQKCGGTCRFDFCEATDTVPKSAACRQILAQT